MGYTQQAEEIQRQMARIRCNLNDEVGEIVQSARVMSDWQYYVRTYPWICAGVAMALGYLVVPHRLEIISPDAKTLARLAKQNRLLVKPVAEPQNRAGALGSLVSPLASMFVRSLVGYAGQNLSRMISLEAVKGGVGSGEPNARRSQAEG